MQRIRRAIDGLASQQMTERGTARERGRERESERVGVGEHVQGSLESSAIAMEAVSRISKGGGGQNGLVNDFEGFAQIVPHIF